MAKKKTKKGAVESLSHDEITLAALKQKKGLEELQDSGRESAMVNAVLCVRWHALEIAKLLEGFETVRDFDAVKNKLHLLKEYIDEFYTKAYDLNGYRGDAAYRVKRIDTSIEEIEKKEKKNES